LGYGQELKNDENAKIYATCLNFLKWYRDAQRIDSITTLVKKPSIPLIKEVYVNAKYKKLLINNVGVERYIDFYRKSGFLSEVYLSGLKLYFNEINKSLTKNKPVRRNDTIKIDGLDLDIQLQTYEPEEIFDNLYRSKITQMHVIYNKALVGIHFNDNIDMIFQLTKVKGKWLIDYTGHDNTSIKSIFRQ